MSLNLDKITRIANGAVKKSDHHTYQLGCIIIRKNKVIAVAANSLKTHPKSPHPYQSSHAEFKACLMAGFENLRGTTVVIYRLKKDGTLANAHPCATCYQLLKEHGVHQMIYTNKGGFTTEVIF